MQGVFASVWGVASVVGAPLGGLLVEEVGWRAVFYLNLPFGLAAALIVGRVLEEPPRERRSRELDVAGALALSLGLAALLAALQRSGSGTLLDVPGIAATVAGLLLLGVFALRERRAAEPLVDPALLRNRIFLAASAGGFLGFAALYSATAHVPMLVRGVQLGDARQAGVALVPLSLSWVVASIACGRLLLRVGYRALTSAGGAAIVAGCAGLAHLDVGFDTSRLYAALAVLGAGMGLMMTSFVVAVQGAAPPGRLGIATSSVQFFRTLGAACGVALLGAVLLGALHGQGVDASAVVVADAMPGAAPALAPEVLMAGLARVFGVGTLFAAGALAAGLAMPRGGARELAEPSRL
jgi:MFS family permease